MKKLLLITLACCLFLSYAVADGIDLSSMSFDELKELQQQINKEIISRPEWKEVVVPGGVWTVGKDIPAGFYCISAGKDGGYVTIEDPNSLFSIVSQGIRDESSKIGKIELKDGFTVSVERGSVVFSPATSLGF